MPTEDQHVPQQQSSGGDEQLAAEIAGATVAQDPQLLLSDEVNRVAVGGSTTLVGLICGKVFGLIGNLLLSRLLGADSFGLWSLARSVVSIGEIVGGGGLPGGVARFTALAFGDRDGRRLRGTLIAGRRMSLAFSLVAAALTAAGAGWIARRLFHDDRLAFPVMLLAGTIVLTVLTNLHQAASNGLQAMHHLVLTRDLVLPAGLVLLGAAVWVFGGGLFAVLMGYYVVAAVAMVLATVLAERSVHREAHLMHREAPGTQPLTESRRLLLFSLPLMFSSLANFGANYSDRLIVGAMLGPRETGYYVAALQWASGVTLVLNAYAQVFGPTIARIHHRGRLQELGSLLKALTAWIITWTLPIGILMILLARPLMQAFGPGFVSGTACLMVLCVAALFNAGTGPIGITLVMSGRPGLESINVLVAAVLTLLLTWLLTPIYGITGAALATGFTTILANLMRLVEVRLLLGIHPYSRQSMKPLAAAAVGVVAAGAVLRLAPDTGGALHAATAAAFIVIYGVLLVLLRVPRDQAPLVADLRRRLGRGRREG